MPRDHAVCLRSLQRGLKSQPKCQGVARVVCSRRPGLRQQQEAVHVLSMSIRSLSCATGYARVFFMGQPVLHFTGGAQWHTTFV